MSTTTDTSYNTMLNENVTNKLLDLELKKRSAVYNLIPQDKNWLLNNNYVLPQIAGVASSVRFGKLVASNNIRNSKPIRGYESVHKEIWGAIQFNAKDLLIHDKVSEQNFMKLLPDELERHMDYMAQVIGQNICSGKAVDAVTVDGDASGNISIANPERVQIRQYVEFFSDTVLAAVSGYVKSININTGALVIVTTPDGVTGVDLSTLLVADNAKLYCQGQSSEGFYSIIDLLLPQAAGGSANLHNLNKLSSPMLQSVYADGTSWTSSTMLKNIFKQYVKARKVGAGEPNNVMMSFNNLGAAISSIEAQKGAFNVTPNSSKAEQYSWDELTVGGFLSGGRPVKLVAIQEMNDSEMVFLDKSSFVIASCGGVRKQKTPDGLSYFTERTEDGYVFTTDTCLMGQLICKQANKNGLVNNLAITY